MSTNSVNKYKNIFLVFNSYDSEDADFPKNGTVRSTILGYTKYLLTASHNLPSMTLVTMLQSTDLSPTVGRAVSHRRGGARKL